MQLTLTHAQIKMLSDALAQYVDNNDPEECVDVHTPRAEAARLQLMHSLAVEMCDAMATQLIKPAHVKVECPYCFAKGSADVRCRNCHGATKA